jgi:hypothetical protein
MKYSVDRIEEAVVICEDENEEIVRFKLSALPEGIKEGDLFSFIDGVAVIIEDETAARKKEIFDLQKSIFSKRKRV